MSDFDFYPVQRIIQIKDGVTEVDATDLYSRWKDWAILNPQWLSAFRVVGGDPTIGSNRISPYYFLVNGWRLKPSEANQTLQVSGILLVDGGGDPYLSTDGTFNVRIVATIPLEAEFIVAQLPEIEFASFQNAVWVDINSPDSGTLYPRGTRQRPVNNLSDALSILAVQGFGRLGLLSSLTVGAGHNIEDVEIFGTSTSQILVTILPEALTERARFLNVSIQGELDGNTSILDCEIRNLHYVNGVIKRSTIRSDATILIDGGANAEIVDCNSGPPENIESFPIIDMGGAGQSLSVRNFNGKLKITNKTGPEKISLDINSGHIFIDETVTSGIVVSRGLGRFEDHSTGTAVIVSEDMINRVGIANAVWEDNIKERALGDHNKAGFFLSRTVNDIGDVTNVAGNEVTFSGSSFNLAPGLYDNRIIQFHKNGEYIYEVRKVIEHKADGVLVLDKVPVLVSNLGSWHAYVLMNIDASQSSSEIASEVWNSTSIDFSTPGSFGEKLGSINYEEIAMAVWNKQINAMSAEDFLISIKNAIDSLDLSVDAGPIAEAVWNEQIGLAPEDIAKTILLNIQSELNNLDVNVDEASIAAAVWNSIMADYTNPGTTGNSLATASSGGVDVNVLADAVWDHTTGQQVSTDVNRIKNIEEGNWKIEGTQMIFFDLEGNEMFRFDLKNQSGQPSNENVFQRVRV